jgi:HTH-type transcriptional regulator/antitoxin HipB
MLRAMDDQRLGTALRQVRIRRGLRQSDLARVAGVSQSTISRIERGHFGALSIDTARRVAAALDVRIDMVPRWRAGDLDRLLNARHSQFHELVARRFRELPGWVMRPEVSFAVYRERGVIDILAYHPGRRMLLVIELKTDIADVNELVGTVDRKRRLAVRVASDLGWPIESGTQVSVWVIVADGATNRRRIGAHRAMLRAAFPTDGRVMGGWLRDPASAVQALSNWSDSHPGTARVDLRSVRRVAKRRGVDSAACGRSKCVPRGTAAGPPGELRVPG